MKPIPPEAATKFGYAGKAQTYISFVDPNSPADKAGVQAGDAVMEVGTQSNPTIDQIKAAAEMDEPPRWGGQRLRDSMSSSRP